MVHEDAFRRRAVIVNTPPLDGRSLGETEIEAKTGLLAAAPCAP
jgi:hypothetical protein